MRKRLKTGILGLLALALFLLCGCSPAEPEPTPDPYAGMVQVPDGGGGLLWIVESEVLPASGLEASAFAPDGAYISYTGTEYTALRGVDVSFYQGDIDWSAVAADGVEFAMIRVGYRGYANGELCEDEKFLQNITGAQAAGLRVGAYFFSQAVSTEEAAEEAAFVLERLADFDVTMPVAFDWEPITFDESSRTMHTPGGKATDCAIVFCDAVKAAGYEPSVYFYRSLGYHIYELDRLADYAFWVGALGTYPDFYYAHSMWQYSITGQVAGIPGDTDLDLYFIENTVDTDGKPDEKESGQP